MRFRHFAILLLILPISLAGLYPFAVRCGMPEAQSAPASNSNYPMDKPLVDAKTEAIFANATRVQVFQLFEDEPEPRLTKAQLREVEKNRLIEDYVFMGSGPTQGHSFAKKLTAALSRISAQESAQKPAFIFPQCFSPGVAFRAWRGKEEATAFVCFHCSGVEVVSRDAQKRESWHGYGGLGDQRAVLLALSKQALRKDADIQALKS